MDNFGVASVLIAGMVLGVLVWGDPDILDGLIKQANECAM